MLKETFLNKLKQKHPNNFNKYDYSLVPDEFKTKDKVSIRCLIHGEFKQQTNSHLRGTHCRKCTSNSFSLHKTFTTDLFIQKGNEVHNWFYTYPRTNYTGALNKIFITCPIHGDFEQAAYKHLSGQRCKKCFTEYRINLQKSNIEEFIYKARLIHGDKYDYSKVVYINNHTKVIIICKTHGEFLQAPHQHLGGSGCPRCRESHGEKHIVQILDKYNIKYIREYRLLENRYRYDFYLPEYNIYIEYHGRQHYEIDTFFGGNVRYEKTQRNDLIKIELIKRSSGLLIVIKHTFKTKEQIEDELIRLFTIIHPQFLNNKETVKQAIISSNIYLIEDGISYRRKK